jgi:hypothetical protein
LHDQQWGTGASLLLPPPCNTLDSALGHVGAVQDLKEVIQFPLQCAFDQVQQEQEHDRKGQGAVTGEICFRASMPGKKGGIVDQITK